MEAVPSESNSTPAPVSPEIAELERNLEVIIEMYRQCGIIVEEFTESSQPVLNAKLNAIIDQLRLLDSMSTKFMEDPKIPLQLLDFVDEGRNPDIFTKEFLDTTVYRNDLTRGKIRGLKKFRDLLWEEYNKKPDKEEMEQ